MARKGQFKKGGGRHGGATHARRRRSKRRHSTAMTHAPRRSPTRHSVGGSRRRRRHGGGSGPLKLTHLALATAGLAFVTKAGATDGFQKTINDAMDKVPGTKTFGATAMMGVIALGVDRFIKPNKWLKLLGTAGIVLAAAQVGTKGSDFKFLGDESSGDYDLSGDDDVGDDDDDDEEGDYDE